MKAYSASFILPITSKPLTDAMIVVDDHEIVDIDTKKEILHRYPSIDVEECGQSVIMPGLVNAHTHLDLLFFQNSQTDAAKAQFFDWLVAGWLYRKNQTLNDRRQALEEGMHQLVRSGTTTVGDTGQFFGLIPQAANAPLRMVLFPEILTGGDTGVQDAYEGAFAQVDEIQANRSNKVTAGIAPYAAYTLSRNLLKILSQQAMTLNVPVKMHVAETFSEMQFFYESTGEIADKLFPQMGWGDTLPPPHRKTPIQFLHSIGFLETAPTLIGGNQLSETDLELIVKTKTKLVHAPRYNAHLSLGHPPLKKLRELKVPLALGTDALASISSLSLWDEMRYIIDRYPENDQPSHKDLLEMATIEGARALGLERKIGSLEKGKEADFIVVHVPKELTAADLTSWLITHVTPREIMSVYVEGKKVKL